jgi:hypothetical protein
LIHPNHEEAVAIFDLIVELAPDENSLTMFLSIVRKREGLFEKLQYVQNINKIASLIQELRIENDRIFDFAESLRESGTAAYRDNANVDLESLADDRRRLNRKRDEFNQKLSNLENLTGQSHGKNFDEWDKWFRQNVEGRIDYDQV